jgi:hypothetical protein
MRKTVLIRRIVLSAFYVSFLWSGCATETVKPTFPTASGLKRPDRVLVYEFAVTQADLTPGGIVGSGLNQPAPQTEEDIRVGRALAKTLSENLVAALRRRDIKAFSANDATPPAEDTALIRGRFESPGRGEEAAIGFSLREKELRTRIQVLQGGGLDVRVVAESQYTMPSSLRPGMSSNDIVNAVSNDANRAAQALAARVADYYRSQGWLE